MADPNYHNANGSFKPGNPGGTGGGNPRLKRQIQYQDAIKKAVKTKDIIDILKKLVEKAKRGDEAAAKIILDRVLGKVPKDLNVNQTGLQNIAITFEETK